MVLGTGVLPAAADDATLADQIAAVRSKTEQYVQQQGDLQSQAQLSEQGLQDAQAQLAKQEAVVDAAQKRLQDTNNALQKAKKQRSVNMRESYVTASDNSTLNALLGSGSLSEFLRRNQYVNILTEKKFQAVNSIDNLIDKLDFERRDLVTKQNALENQNNYLRQRIAQIQQALADNKSNLAVAQALENSLLAHTGILNQNDRPFLKNNQPVGDTITFMGSGTEHGLGMSQYGAKGFAEHGWKYQDILSHYYPGTKLTQVGTFSTNQGSSEDYLVRVVSGEISGSWPMETLKAQAVAARSYAYKNQQNQDCTARTQACGTPNERARQAVEATRGQVLTYNGDVIAAYFHSTSGGWTENNENVWGGTPLAWLRGASSPYETDSPHWEWHTKTYAKAAMGAILNQDARTAVGELKSLKITGRGVSGRVTVIQVIGTNGTVKTVSGPTFKTIFNVNSPADEDGLRNTLFGFV